MATPIPTNRARFTIYGAAAATRGLVVKPGDVDVAVGVTSDSRAVVPGCVFVALRGEKVDAHEFVVDAATKGAAISIIERGRIGTEEYARIGRVPGASVIEVDDTLVALGDLARAHLEAWRSGTGTGAARRRVVAITGSAGKTTTKELCAALLGAAGPTHFTAGNLNNRIGVPSVVLGLEETHRFAVLEMGMSLRGELDAIVSFARPDVSIVTNVGVAHAEGVGGRDGVMHEKGAVYRALSDEGVAVVNADDDFATRAAEGTRAGRVLTFGTKEGATYRLVRREPRGDAGSLVVIATPMREIRVLLPLPGEAAAIDLVAALAAQEAASGDLLAPERIEAALEGVRLEGRATASRLASDIVVLDDTYNANPASMRAALATLVELAGERRRVAVLGEMKELGDHAEREHEALGAVIADAGVALAIGCGGLIGRALERAAARGVEVVVAASTDEAAREARARVRPSDAVLVKGSRSVGAERVVSVLTEAWPSAAKSASSGME